MTAQTLDGIDEDGRHKLTLFDPNQPLPFQIGSLEREALRYLGDWMTIAKPNESFGFFYRFGVKEEVLDADKESATVFLHFVVPYVQRGRVATPETLEALETAVGTVIQQTTRIFSGMLGNAIGVRAEPPEYMMRELTDLIK